MNNTARNSFLKFSRTLWRFLGWRFLAYGIAIAVLGQVTLLPPQLFRLFAAKSASLDVTNASQFVAEVLGFGLLIAFCLTLSALGSLVLEERFNFWFEARLRRKAWNGLQHFPLAGWEDSHLFQDLSGIEFFVTERLPVLIRNASVLIATAVLLVWNSGEFSLLPMLAAGLLAFLSLRTQEKTHKASEELGALHATDLRSLVESSQGIRTIRSLSIEPFIERRLESIRAESSKQGIKRALRIGSWLGTHEGVLQTLVTVGLAGAVWVLAQGKLSGYEALSYIFFIGMFYHSAITLAAGIPGKLPSTGMLEPQEFVSASKIDTSRADALVLEEVDGASCKIERGSLWAILGSSLEMQAAFLEQLAGLRVPMSGRIEYLSGENRIWKSDRSSPLPSGAVAFIEHTPYLFEGTLRENLVFGNERRVSDAIIWNYLSEMGLYESVRAYGGLDFQVRDQGRNLRWEIRYPLSICRGLLLQRPFLVLEEPPTFVDLQKLTCHAAVIAGLAQLPEKWNGDGVIYLEKFGSRVEYKKNKGSQVTQRHGGQDRMATH